MIGMVKTILMKIRTKIIVVCIGILLMNSIASGMIYYNYAVKDTLENYKSSAKDLTGQMNYHLDREIYSVLESIYAMCNNATFTKNLSGYVNNPSSVEYPKIMGYMSDALTEVRSGNKYIHSLYTYTRFGEFENFTKVRNHEFDFAGSYLQQPFIENENLNIKWFPAEKSQIFVDNEIVIPVVYKYQILYSREYLYVVVNFSAAYIQKYLKDNYSSFEHLYLLDEDGNEVVGTMPHSLAQSKAMMENLAISGEGTAQETMVYDDATYLGTFSKMPTSHWVICALRSEQSLLKNMEVLQRFIVTLLLITSIISIIIIIFLSYSITNPLRKLVQSMNQVKRGDFHVHYQYKGKDEVGNLVDNFNIMVREINRLIKHLNIQIDALEKEKVKVKEIQEQKRVAELKALQSQINPHFLYNTLNTITWEAASAGITTVSDISNALGKFFRIVLSDGKEIITFEEELEHVSSYLKIQKIRYKTKLNYQIMADSSLYSIHIIKLIIQPLVENAIYHGIKEKTEGGLITVSAQGRTNHLGNQVLIITVEDDGVGISPEKLEEINETLMSGEINEEVGYGIYNVNERIRLYFGEEYGLSLESELGHWTKSILIIPKL